MKKLYEDAKKERGTNKSKDSIDMIWKFVVIALLAS